MDHHPHPVSSLANEVDMDRSATIERLYPLVQRVAGKLTKSLPSHVQHEDLVSSGVVGLIQALDRFQPALNDDLESYCVSRIRGAILDDLRSQDWIPRSVHRDVKAYQNAVDSLEQKYGRPASDEEVRCSLKLSPQAFQSLKLRMSHSMCSLPLDCSALSDEPSPLESMMIREDKALLLNAIRSLSKQQKTCLVLYYFDELTLKQIGSLLSVSESRVCQVMAIAVRSLKESLSASAHR